MCSLLLCCPLLLLSLFILSSSFPGCRVMYGPCQHWNQWDASCFNLAWEPSGSRSSASWKSDGSGLSFPLFAHPSLCRPSAHWSTLSSHWIKLHGGPHKASENKGAHLLFWICITTNRWGTSQSGMPQRKHDGWKLLLSLECCEHRLLKSNGTHF